jgi:hypothetical protein
MIYGARVGIQEAGRRSPHLIALPAGTPYADLPAGYVLGMRHTASSSPGRRPGLADSAIRNDTSHLELIRD